MNFLDLLEPLFLIAILICLIPVLGTYMLKVFSGKRTWVHGLLGWLELSCYRIAGINPASEMTWWVYSKTLFVFNFFGFILLFLLQLFQNEVFLNPQHLPGIPWDLAFNTAISFVTNTNWQSYAGETTMSYFTQMFGFTAQNFLSAATGMSVLIALIRGITNKTSETIGNFWADLVRTIVYILLPLSFLLAMVLVSEGTIQTFSPYVEATTLENHPQTIPLGPVASQAAIKQLGTNGGGFFNVNAAHPFENPTGVTNFLQTLAILLIPAASVYTYGCLIGSRSQGILSLGIMFFLFALGLLVAYLSAHLYNPAIDSHQILEGKDTRLGTTNSLTWTAATTATSNGGTNAMLSSLSPLGGGVALFNIMIGEMVFGGIGTGLCHMLMFTLLTVFLCGLMVGRTPEFLGKKIERTEIQWIVLAILTPSALVLIGAGLFSVWPATLSGIGNAGPHGLTEILYAFASSAGNNGSSFASLQTNTLPYNLALGLVILIARIVIILASLGIAGSLSKKTISPPSVGSLSTNSFMFAVLLTSIILTVGALSFFPALSLGPIAEEILMLDGRTF